MVCEAAEVLGFAVRSFHVSFAVTIQPAHFGQKGAATAGGKLFTRGSAGGKEGVWRGSPS